MNMSNPLSQRTSPESICLRAFLLVLAERSTTIFCSDPKDVTLQEEMKACDRAIREGKAGVMFPRYMDLMAKVIQGMGYVGDEGYAILTFFRSRMPCGIDIV